MKKKNVIFLILIIILDQIIKYNIQITRLSLDLNVFKVNYTSNTGIVFGILNNDIILIILINLVVLIGIITYLFIKKDISGIGCTALTLILAGGSGNFIDRITRGYVIDYIDINKWINFPIFNISDIMITFGVILLSIAVIKKY